MVVVFGLCKILTLEEVGWRIYGNSVLSLQVFVSLKLFQNKGFLNESRNLEKAIEGLENKNEEISHR